MDRRSFQVSPLLNNSSKQCVHLKNIYSLVDLTPADESYKRIMKHQASCLICSEKLKEFEEFNRELKVHIPKPQIDTETKAIFENEIHELFKTIDLNEKELLRKKIKTNFQKIDSFGVGFFKVLFSKNMMKSYLFGLVLFIILKQVFN